MSRRSRAIGMRLLAGVLWGLIVTGAEVSILPLEAMPWRGQLFCNNNTGKGNIAWRA